MKKTFELEYPDGRMVIADIVQKTLCRHWAMPVYVREVGVPPEPPEELRDLAVGIADLHPTERIGGDFRCIFCNQRWPFEHRGQSMVPDKHSSSCIWRRAKAYAKG